MRLGLIADTTEIALSSYKKLIKKYNFVDFSEDKKSEIDILVILGGDGFMLHSMHRFKNINIPIFGMNCGTIGFLLNEFSIKNLEERIKDARTAQIWPLAMKAVSNDGTISTALAFNEVSLLRETRQAADIEVIIDGKTRLNNLIGDGVLVATPAGSSAYNFSVRGPIVPIASRLITLTPISPFRPRQWRGALLPGTTEVKFIINNPSKRPVSVVADFNEFRDIKEVTIKKAMDRGVSLLFDKDNHLEDKLLTEQFS